LTTRSPSREILILEGRKILLSIQGLAQSSVLSRDRGIEGKWPEPEDGQNPEDFEGEKTLIY
jgi:hypothetical protein